MALNPEEQILIVRFKSQIKKRGMNIVGFWKVTLKDKKFNGKKIEYNNLIRNINGYSNEMNPVIKKEIEKFLSPDSSSNN